MLACHKFWFDNIRFLSSLQTQIESSLVFQSLLSLGGVFTDGDFVELEIFRPKVFGSRFQVHSSKVVRF